MIVGGFLVSRYMGDIDERGDIDLVYECAAESTSTCSTPQSSSLLIIHGTQDGE